jgi:hypothetical protein
MNCGITNLGQCLVENFFEFLIYLFNLPIRSFLILISNLLIEPVNIEIFASLWSIMIYMLSLFYGILLVITGFRFLMSGHSVEQREKAKRSLTSIIIMMILVQASYFLYSLSLELISSMTSVMFSMIPNDFFLLTTGSLSNIGLELVLLVAYLSVLLLALIFLTLRYILVSVGVVLCAFGIFCYFFEPLESYGRLILNYLGVLIALPFFYSIILLASSKLLEVGIFSEIKIVAMIGGFVLVDIFTAFLLLFVIIKAASVVAKPVKQIVSLVGAGA